MKRKTRKKRKSTRGRTRLVALEKRRRRAARLFKAKKKQAEVARLLGVSRQSVSRWYRQWHRGGVDRLKGADRAGRKPRLDSAQLKKVAQALLKGARSHGFPTNLWTLKRVATVIERVTGVHFHPGHVWKILGEMGWSLQKPAKRAKERKEEAVRQWIGETWPAIKKKARKKRGWIVFQDESGVSQKPPLRRTWAPKGETPVVVHSYKWDKLSVSAAVAYRCDGKRSRVYFDIIPGSYDSQKLIQFLKELKRHFRGTHVVLIWDGLMAHRSAEMKAFLDEQRDWLEVEQLPGYAPDLNPVEFLWGNIKGQELANQSADDLGDVADAATAGFERVKSHKQLTFGFLKGTGLSF